jgi:hypothetical protein
MTGHHRRLAFLASIALVVLVGACSSAATPSPTAAPTPEPTPAPTAAPASASATPEAPASAAATSEPSTAAQPSDLGSFGALMHGDPNLEAALPDKVGSTALQKLSFKGDSSFLGAAGQSSQMQSIQAALAGLGKSMSDVGIAIAVPVDTSAGDSISVGAYQIAGVDASAFWGAMQSAFAKAASDAQVSDANVGGKSVKKVVATDTTTYIYPHGDTLFFVSGKDDSLVSQALSQLP